MNAELIEQPGTMGYAAHQVTKAPEWHDLVVFDMLFNNLSTGLFLVAGVGELARPELLGSVASIAYPVAWLLLLCDLALLVLDLGDPRRFHHMLRVFKIGSPMSLGTWCLTCFSFPLTVLALLGILAWFGIQAPLMRIAFICLAFVPGFGSAAYKGVLFSTSSQPGWRDARWLGAYVVSSALALGCGQLLIIAAAMGHHQAIGYLQTLFAVALVFNGVTLAVDTYEMHGAWVQAHTQSYRWLIAFLVVGVGLALPFVMAVWGTEFWQVVAAVLFIGGCLLVRYEFVMLPHNYKKHSERLARMAEAVPGTPQK